MNIIKWLILSILVVLTFGCATPAKMENMVYWRKDFHSYDKALENQVAITSASGGKETDPLGASQISIEAFSAAVKKSLISHGLFSDAGRYHLKITMEKTDQPTFGTNFTVWTYVNYILTDSTNNSVILNTTIIASYTATVGDALIGAERLRLANEGSGKENIRKLLEKLSALEITEEQISVID